MFTATVLIDEATEPSQIIDKKSLPLLRTHHNYNNNFITQNLFAYCYDDRPIKNTANTVITINIDEPERVAEFKQPGVIQAVPLSADYFMVTTQRDIKIRAIQGDELVSYSLPEPYLLSSQGCESQVKLVPETTCLVGLALNKTKVSYLDENTYVIWSLDFSTGKFQFTETNIRNFHPTYIGTTSQQKIVILDPLNGILFYRINSIHGAWHFTAAEQLAITECNRLIDLPFERMFAGYLKQFYATELTAWQQDPTLQRKWSLQNVLAVAPTLVLNRYLLVGDHEGVKLVDSETLTVKPVMPNPSQGYIARLYVLEDYRIAAFIRMPVTNDILEIYNLKVVAQMQAESMETWHRELAQLYPAETSLLPPLQKIIAEYAYPGLRFFLKEPSISASLAQENLYLAKLQSTLAMKQSQASPTKTRLCSIM